LAFIKITQINSLLQCFWLQSTSMNFHSGLYAVTIEEAELMIEQRVFRPIAVFIKVVSKRVLYETVINYKLYLRIR